MLSKKEIQRIVLITLALLNSAFGFEAADYFEKNCSSCHSIGEGIVVGPDLEGVTERRPKEWIFQFIRNSESLIKSGDPAARDLYNKFEKITMPPHDLNNEELNELYDFLKKKKKKIPPSPVTSPLAEKKEAAKGYAPKQPFDFSHKIHSGDNQIQCLYCHFAAQSSPHAGIPPLEICMNCHTHVKSESLHILKMVEVLKSGKPISWNKVNFFPSFTYFNHSQHIIVAKISCQSCHGEIQNFNVLAQTKMFSMGWCVKCHRENGIAAPKDHKKGTGGDCARCHH